MTVLAKRLGVTRQTVYTFVEKHKLQDELETEKKRTIERVKNRRAEMAIHGDDKNSSTWNAMKSILTRSYSMPRNKK